MKLSSDSPRDQYVVYVSGQVTANPLSPPGVNNKPHGLSFIPLIYVQWSETADFSTPRELWQNSSDAYPASEPWIINADADINNINFVFQNFGGSSKTLYFRAWGFMPSDVSVKTPHTSGNSGFSDYLTNSDMNYLKLHSSGIVTINTSGIQVVHGLGKLPVVMIWEEFGAGSSKIIHPLFTPFVVNRYEEGTPSVNTNAIVFPYQGFGSKIFHYRIYKDAIYG